MARARRLALLALAAHTNLLVADEWPGLRGPNHDGSAAVGNSFGGTDGGMALRWRATVGSGYSGVAVGSGHAVTMFSDGPKDVMAAFDIDAGRETWRVTVGEAHKGLREAHQRFAGFLRERGYRPAGGEVADGVGWASWRNRNDQPLEALFPAVP